MSKWKIDPEFCPPFHTEVERDRVSICNGSHVIAVMWIDHRYALSLSDFIANACNKHLADIEKVPK